MDESLALRLDSRSEFYDEALYRKCGQAALDYVRNGLGTLSYFEPDLDAANDLSNALAGLPAGTNATQFDKIERSATNKYAHPAGATQIDSLATSVSQILFGGETNRRVEARRAEEEAKADALNQLLAWNDQQNETYVDGFLFIKDAIIFNRGVQYDYWTDQYENEREPVEYELPVKRPKKGQPETRTVTRFRTVRKKVGGYNKIVNISPYDFVCDPTVPLSRFQEGRFAGHRVILSWQELKRRSELPVTDYLYVLPEVVKRLKNQKSRKVISALGPGSTMISQSRSYFERMRRGNPSPDLGLSDKVNKDDGGTVECWVMTARIRPKAYGIYEDDEDELVEFLLAGETDILSVNIRDNTHGDFPYAVAEARPNAHMQFGPSVALIMKPTQDQIDSRKWRHEEQIERSGMLFLADPTKCNIETVLKDTSRVRQAILRTADGQGEPVENIIDQIPVKDSTATFNEEMLYWKKEMEEASGAQPNIQGKTDDPSQTLGQYQDVAQMAMGRISTIARNISSRCLVRQTRRIAMNLQQWMSDQQTIRITGQTDDHYDPETPPPKFMTIRREPMDADQLKAMDAAYQQAVATAQQQGQEPPPMPPELLDAKLVDIQFAFDVTPHDGAMPGTDARAVAAAGRLIEAAANPAFQQCFNPTIPGNIDPRALLFWTAKKAGLPSKNFIITRETAQKNLQDAMDAQGMPQPGAPQPQPQPQGPPAPVAPDGTPSASQLAPNPSAEPPQAQGTTLTL
jgi:hypothetical protein